MKYTIEILQPVVSSSTSVSQVLEKLGVKFSGGMHYHIKNLIKRYELDTSHFLGQGHRKGRVALNKSTPETYLIMWDKSRSVNTDGIKKRMFRDGIKEKRCEKCGLTEWLGEEIPLAIHHKDGDRWNNNLDNIEILCYNCHGQTESYAGKK